MTLDYDNQLFEEITNKLYKIIKNILQKYNYNSPSDIHNTISKILPSYIFCESVRVQYNQDKALANWNFKIERSSPFEYKYPRHIYNNTYINIETIKLEIEVPVNNKTIETISILFKIMIAPGCNPKNYVQELEEVLLQSC